jgi:cytidylate kinase
MTRENSPLVCVPDAHVIDSSSLNIDQVCEEVFKLVEKIKS